MVLAEAKERLEGNQTSLSDSNGLACKLKKRGLDRWWRSEIEAVRTVVPNEGGRRAAAVRWLESQTGGWADFWSSAEPDLMIICSGLTRMAEETLPILCAEPVLRLRTATVVVAQRVEPEVWWWSALHLLPGEGYPL